MTDDDAPKPMAVFCPACDHAVVVNPIGHTFYDEPREGPPERWTLARCPQWHPVLIVQNNLGGPMTYDDDTPWRVYPPQDRFLSHDIPAVLRAAHEEARKCFHAKSYPGAVIMCGRTLEATCKLNGVTTGSLESKLDMMKEMGLIDGRLLEWAHTLRRVRNAAAHADEGANVLRQDAEDVLAYSEALLDYLYVMKARFDALKARRASATQIDE